MLARAEKVTRFDLPYPTRTAPARETVPEPETPRIFDVESVGPASADPESASADPQSAPADPQSASADPDATTVMRRSDIAPDDGPEDAA